MLRRGYDGWMLAAFGTVLLFGVYLNPSITTATEQWNVVLQLEGVAALLLIAWEIGRRAADCEPAGFDREGQPGSLSYGWAGVRWARSGAVLAIIFGCWLLLYLPRWRAPTLFLDDYRYFADAQSWRQTVAQLFVPFNEHLVVPARLWTYAIAATVPQPWWPAACAATAVVFVASATVVLFLVAGRTLQNDSAGLLAAALFTLTHAWDEVVVWYAATLWLIPLIMLLMALLLATPNGRICRSRLGLIAALSSVGPFCFSLGFLIGPMASAWMVLLSRDPLRWRKALVPIAATLVGGLMALHLIRQAMQQSDYWERGGRGMWEAFDLGGGLVYSVRCVVDRLMLANLGWGQLPTPPWVAAVLFPVMVVGIVLVARVGTPLAWLLPPILLVVFGYGTTLPFRTWEKYAVVVHWSRYQMLPQFGLALVLAGAMRHGWPWFGATGREGSQIGTVVAIAFLLTLLHTIGY